MSLAALWAWMLANEAAVATILLVISEFLGSVPALKSNGIISFILVQFKEFAKRKGAKDSTP
jgi:hypothetical protein